MEHGKRYLFLALDNRVFIADYLNSFTNNIVVNNYSDIHYIRCGQSVHSIPKDHILQAYLLTDLVAGNKYRFCYIHKNKVDENNTDYEHKFYEGAFIEIIDRSETLLIDARMNKNGIISVPLTSIVNIVAI